MTPNEVIKVLLIEDDEDDYVLTRGLFEEIKGQEFQLEWIDNFEQGLQAMRQGIHEVYLVDYRLGKHNGVELLRAGLEQGCPGPVILLTGQGEHEIDLEAMRAGAADYLVKGRLDSRLLERSIRYALGRKRAAARAAAEQARLAAFGAEVGLALTQRDGLQGILQRCAKAMVQYLEVDLARIWTYEPEEKAFKLLASDGRVVDPWREGKQTQPAVDNELLTGIHPALVYPIAGHRYFKEQEWAAREGLVSYAGYPLVLEDRVAGLLSLFSREPLRVGVLQELGSVANGIALCIERKRSEEALGVSEFKYRSVVENIKEIIFQVNESGRFTFLNPAWTGITGFRVKETLNTPLIDYIHPEDRQRHWQQFEELIQRKLSHFRDEARYLASDGSFRWVEVYAQPTLDGVSLGSSGTIRDITDRKRAEAEIQKLAAFVRLNPDPVIELTGDGTITYLNPAARELAGSLGMPEVQGMLPKGAGATAQECLRLGQSNLRQEVTLNGRTLSWSFFPIISSQVVHCYGSDITERISLESQLRHSQKLESIGQLAAGVAHDFNNILTIIEGHTGRLLELKPDERDIVDPLQEIAAAAVRGASLTRQLLTFSRKQVMQLKVLDLNTVIKNMTQMLHRLLGEDIALEPRYGEELPAIEADAGMVEQILMNLAVNSRDAMPNGGQLIISTTAVNIDEAYVQQHPEAHEGGFVCLSISDTGCGMSQETLARIFEPFFTTKAVGKGTGLGLATVYGIVKQHQGWAEVSSTLGAGTTFRIYFPGTNRKADLVVEPLDSEPVGGNQESILLVEDEPVLRELARMVLEDYNYQVFEAANGIEALRVWGDRKGEIDLLLTDMVMPEGISGRELAEKLKSHKPRLKIVYTSGYSAEIMGSDLTHGEIRFLQKPYPPPQLARVVRECLDMAA